VGWEGEVSELWDNKGNRPALTGPSVNKLETTGIVEVEGARCWRDGIVMQE
jgi:hypothetical protein